MSFVPAGVSKKKRNKCVSLTPIELLRLLYFLPAAERIAGFYIRFTGHARLLGKKRTSRKKSEK